MSVDAAAVVAECQVTQGRNPPYAAAGTWHSVTVTSGHSRDAVDENVENGLGRVFDLGVSDAPAREVAVDVHSGKTIDQRTACDLDLLQLGRSALASCKCIRQHPHAVEANWLLSDEMEFATELVVYGDDGAVDVADQAVAEQHVGNLPVAAPARIRTRCERAHARGLASGLVAQRFIRDDGQF